MYVSVCIYVYIYICVCVCNHAVVYVHICMCIFLVVCMHTHTLYVCISNVSIVSVSCPYEYYYRHEYVLSCCHVVCCALGGIRVSLNNVGYPLINPSRTPTRTLLARQGKRHEDLVGFP